MFAMLLFTHHYPARCFGMNMPKSRDIQAKNSIAAGNLNNFGYVTVNGVNSNVCDCERYYVTRFDLEIIV